MTRLRTLAAENTSSQLPGDGIVALPADIGQAEPGPPAKPAWAALLEPPNGRPARLRRQRYRPTKLAASSAL
jgi:hypothetical protein